MFATYNAITKRSEHVLSWLLKHRLKKGKESPERYHEKMGDTSLPRPNGDLIWIHGASVGESQSALILINRLTEVYPQINILVTTGTLTSAALMEKNLPSNAFHQFYPLDHPKWVNKFLNHWKPNTVLWMESELWPNMLSSIKERNIPAILINARLSDKSYKAWRLIPNMASAILSTFSEILCQDDKSYKYFKKLGTTNTHITGNIKYAASPLKCNKDELKRLIKSINDRPVWLYSSTHNGEEKIACDIHQRLKTSFPDLLTIIVPRHPERREEIIETLVKFRDLKFELRSSQTKKIPSLQTDIYLADTMGELGLFYRLCPLACIGRSLSYDGGGGHNPIEAAQLGCVVLHGKNIQNLQGIYDDMDSYNIAISANSPNILGSHIHNFLSNRTLLEEYQNKSIIYARQKTGIITDILKIIIPIIDKSGIENHHEIETQDQSNAI